MNWRRLSGKPIEDLATEVEGILIAELALGNQIKVCIGTDSQVKGKYVEFASAVVFIRQGKGGFMLVSRELKKGVMGLKQRMLDEVTFSITVAYSLCPILERYDVDLEVHADINTDPNFESNVALKEAMGYIMGMGYEFKAKPNAFASTNCADKMVQ